MLTKECFYKYGFSHYGNQKQVEFWEKEKETREVTKMFDELVSSMAKKEGFDSYDYKVTIERGKTQLPSFKVEIWGKDVS